MSSNDQAFLKRLMDQQLRVKGYLRRAAPKELGGCESVDDLLQETLTVAYANRHRFEGPDDESLVWWLIRIAKNVARNRIRYHLAQKRDGVGLRSSDALASSMDLLAALREVRSKWRSPSSLASLSEAAKKLHTAIAALPETNQKVLRLRFFDGLNSTEIAAQLETTNGAVRGILRRSVIELRKMLSEE